MTERKSGDEARAILKKSSGLGVALMMSRKGRLEKLIERYRSGRRMADLAGAQFRKRIKGYEEFLD